MLILASVLGALAAGAALDALSGGEDETGGEGLAQEAEDEVARPDLQDGLGALTEAETDGGDAAEASSPLGEVIKGGGLLAGGTGDDQVTGSDGVDDLAGGAGNDTLAGLGGDDWIFGDDARFAWGDDDLAGGGGSDTMAGNGGDDLLDGGAGDDRMVGGEGDDTLDGAEGNDWLDGASGDDVLRGGDGDDDLAGGLGDDTLTGGAGADSLHGGAGNDVLAGSAGDVLDGNEGDDRFVVSYGNEDGVALITDYAEGDRIEIAVTEPEAQLSVSHDLDGSATLLIDGHPVAKVMGGSGLALADIVLLRPQA